MNAFADSVCKMGLLSYFSACFVAAPIFSRACLRASPPSWLLPSVLWGSPTGSTPQQEPAGIPPAAPACPAAASNCHQRDGAAGREGYQGSSSGREMFHSIKQRNRTVRVAQGLDWLLLLPSPPHQTAALLPELWQCGLQEGRGSALPASCSSATAVLLLCRL